MAPVFKEATIKFSNKADLDGKVTVVALNGGIGGEFRSLNSVTFSKTALNDILSGAEGICFYPVAYEVEGGPTRLTLLAVGVSGPAYDKVGGDDDDCNFTAYISERTCPNHCPKGALSFDKTLTTSGSL